MTVTEKSSRKLISGSGWTNPLTHDFELENSTHLKVYADDQLLVLGVNYTVSGVGSDSGYSVTINTPSVWTDVSTWVLSAEPPISQADDVSLGGVYGGRFEDGLDALTRRVQRLRDDARRAYKVPRTTSVGEAPTMDVLPEGHIWMADADGNMVDGGPAVYLVPLPAVAANSMIVDNSTGTARETKTFPQVRVLLEAARHVASKSALKAMDPVTDALVASVLGEIFLWRSGDQSSKIRPTVGTTSAVAAAETISGYSATHVLTIVGHGLYTGCPVTPTASVNGLTAGTTYYVIKLSADKFSLASSRSNALAYTVLTLSGTTNVTIKRVVDALEAVYVVPTGYAADGAGGLWERYISGPVSLAWWSPAGDGSTDDSAALAAFADFASVGVFKSFYIPGLAPGKSYWFNTSANRFIIDHVAGLHLYGDGDASQIKFGNSAGSRPFHIMWCSGIAEKLHLNSTGRSGGAWDNVTLSNPSNFVWRDNLVQGADFYGVGAFADIVFPSSLLYMSVAMDNFDVVGNRFVNCGAGTSGTAGYGIECFPYTKSKNLRMVLNTFENCGGFVGGNGTASLKGGSAYENGLIAFNKIVNAPASAIQCGTHESVVITGNEIIDWARATSAGTFAAIAISVNTHPFYLTPALDLMLVERNTIRMDTAMPAASNAYGLSVNGNVTTNGPVCFDDNDVIGCNGALLRSSVAVPFVEITGNRFFGMANSECAILGDATAGAALPKVKIDGNKITGRTTTRTQSQIILASFTDVEITNNVVTKGGNFDLNLTTCAGAIIVGNTFSEPNVANTASVGCVVVTDTNSVVYTLMDNKIIKGAAGNPKSLLVCSSANPTFRSKGNRSDTLATLASSATPNVQGDWLDVPVPEYGIVTSDGGTTLTPFVSAPILQHTGTLTADRTINLGTTNAVAGKTKWRITRTGAGAFNLNVAAIKALATNTWCEVTWNGAVYYLSAYGAL